MLQPDFVNDARISGLKGNRSGHFETSHRHLSTGSLATHELHECRRPVAFGLNDAVFNDCNRCVVCFVFDQAGRIMNRRRFRVSGDNKLLNTSRANRE